MAALKQYGLLDDSGAKEDRRVSLTPLALRILVDTRPGQREDALLESALKPRLFAEYRGWALHRPPDDHCLSELKLDRGFTDDAAKNFMRVFFETMQFAGVGEDEDDVVSSDRVSDTANGAPALEPEPSPQRSAPRMTAVETGGQVYAFQFGGKVDAPLAERIKVEMSVGALRVSGLVRTKPEADTLIQFIQANKALLPDLPDVL